MTIDYIFNICKDLLNDMPQAEAYRNYLSLRVPTDQKLFQFGYFPNIENLTSISSIISEDNLMKFDLLIKRQLLNGNTKTVFFENHNLVMPYKNIYGETIALVGRTLLNDDERQNLYISKYKNTIFKKSRHLFGLYQAKDHILESNIAYIVEGQFDCISAQLNGLKNTVALGSANMSFNQLALILRYTNNIVLVLDNDQAGKVGAERIINKFSKFINIKNIEIPSGFKDLDEFFKENSVEDFNGAFK